jgi:hypothetical protein
MLVEDVNHTIDTWITALEQYSFVQLCIQPSPGSWSLGQVYMHLINATGYFITQAKTCLSNNDHATEEASPAAKAMFLRNDLPDKIIEGPPSNALTTQPNSKQQLITGLMNLKDELTAVDALISESPFNGKTKHPGLHYFNAQQWLQFAEMHLRHHLRQKKRIDDYLKTTANI